MFAAWQWWNYVCGQIPSGKAALRINIDETSVCLFQGDRKGTVFVDKKRRRDEPVQNVSRGKRRCCLTHVAFICDKPDLQALLPQFIIGNEATFLVGALAGLQSACPTNVHLVRQKSAWNNEVLFASIVRRLGVALRAHSGRFQPVLLMDAVRLHTTGRVLAACSAAGIWPVVVPAKMTWLVQPLDTDAFFFYKAHLQEAYQNARAESATGELDIRQFLACVHSAIRYVLQGRLWGAAFDKDGFGSGQARLGSTVKRELQIAEVLQIPAERPSVEQLRLCFPRRSVVPVAALWRPFDPPPPPRAGAGSSAGAAAVGPAVEAFDVRSARTRSAHRRALAAQGSAASDAAQLRGSALVARALPLPGSFARRALAPSSGRGGGLGSCDGVASALASPSDGGR